MMPLGQAYGLCNLDPASDHLGGAAPARWLISFCQGRPRRIGPDRVYTNYRSVIAASNTPILMSARNADQVVGRNCKIA
jgi:hypothetical protein